MSKSIKSGALQALTTCPKKFSLQTRGETIEVSFVPYLPMEMKKAILAKGYIQGLVGESAADAAMLMQEPATLSTPKSWLNADPLRADMENGSIEDKEIIQIALKPIKSNSFKKNFTEGATLFGQPLQRKMDFKKTVPFGIHTVDVVMDVFTETSTELIVFLGKWNDKRTKGGRKPDTSLAKSPEVAAVIKAAKASQITSEEKPVVVKIFSLKNKSISTITSENVNVDAIEKEYGSSIALSKECSPKQCEDCRQKVLCKGSTTPVTEKAKIKLVPSSIDEAAKKMTREQDAIVNTFDGMAKVSASAGSGKTHSMVLRTVNLLLHGGKNIWIGTFTNAAAREIQERLEAFGYTEGVTASTFNGLGDIVIKEHWQELGYTQEPSLASDEVQKDIVIKVLNHCSDSLIEELKDLGVSFSNLWYKISNSNKGGGLVILDLLNEATPSASLGSEWRVHHEYYRSALKGRNCYTFEQQLKAVHMGLTNGWLKFDHIMVDEFQDTNPELLEIVRLMVENTQSAMVVGDDNQCIYEFRDSVPEIFTGFKHHFPSVRELELTKNFRCHPAIQAWANGVKEGTLTNPTAAETTLALTSEIVAHAKATPKGESLAILARTKKELLAIKSELEEEGIPCVLRVPTLIRESLYVEAQIGLGKFLKTGRFLDFALIAKLKGITDDEVIQELASRLSELAPYSDAEWLLELLDVCQDDFFGNHFYSKLRKMADNGANLSKIIDFIVSYDEYNTEESLICEQDAEGVVLSTIHSAKGLEWDHVIISVPNMGITFAPNTEATRLMYVAMTRARKNLTIATQSAIYAY